MAGDPGTIEATVTVDTPGGGGSPRQLPVTLRVPDPRFALSSSAVVLQAPRGGGDPAPSTVDVTNGGRGALPVPQLTTAYVGMSGWLSAEVSGGPGAYVVTLTARGAGLPSGTHAATIAIDAVGATGPARTLSVTLAVPPPELAVSTAEVVIAGPVDGSDPEPVTLMVTNVGSGFLAAPTATVAFPSGDVPAWLPAEVTRTAPPFTVTLRALQSRQTVALEQGVHVATVTLASPGAANPPVVVSVTLSVPPPWMKLDKPSVWLEVAETCPPPSESFRITNGGPGTLPQPTATVEPAAQEWLEATVTRRGDAFVLNTRLTSAPELGTTAMARVTLEAGVSQSTITVFVTTSVLGPITAAFEPQLLTIHAQSGAGDPGPRRIHLVTSGGCIAPPQLHTSYPSENDEGWLGAEAVAEGTRMAVYVQARVAGLSAGTSRTGVITADVDYVPEPPGDPSLPPPLERNQVLVGLVVGELAAASPMVEGRTAHTLTAMPGGGAIAIGGVGDGITRASAEYFHGSGWYALPSMTTPRSWHGALLLADGRSILVAGGQHGDVVELASTEVYDSASGSWRAGPDLTVARSPPSLALLRDGRVLVVSPGVAFADLLDVEANVSTTVGLGRSEYTVAVTLGDGRVLLVGNGLAATYDPDAGTVERTGPMHVMRYRPVLALLPDGRVLAAGGDFQAETSELFDPATGEWTEISGPAEPPFPGMVISLSNGKVASFAGSAAGPRPVELFDPATSSWSAVAALPPILSSFTPARLEDGTILLTGGRSTSSPDDLRQVLTW